MNKTMVLSGIVIFAAVFSLGFSPIGTAYAGVTTTPNEAIPSCGGKPTVVGTSGDDNFGFTDSSAEVYNMKDGDDTVDDIDFEFPHRDVVRMGDGDDWVSIHNGNDTVCLGDGDDFANTQDGYADYVKCGDGFDTVFIDAIDVTDGECELINPIGEF